MPGKADPDDAREAICGNHLIKYHGGRFTAHCQADANVDSETDDEDGAPHTERSHHQHVDAVELFPFTLKVMKLTIGMLMACSLLALGFGAGILFEQGLVAPEAPSMRQQRQQAPQAQAPQAQWTQQLRRATLPLQATEVHPQPAPATPAAAPARTPQAVGPEGSSASAHSPVVTATPAPSVAASAAAPAPREAAAHASQQRPESHAVHGGEGAAALAARVSDPPRNDAEARHAKAGTSEGPLFTDAEEQASSTTTAVPAVPGACGAAADQHIWFSGGAARFDTSMGSCSPGCLGGAECTTNCILKKEKYSLQCATCFGELSGCTIQHCFWICLGGKSSGCATCVDAQCMPDFIKCSGLTPDSS